MSFTISRTVTIADPSNTASSMLQSWRCASLSPPRRSLEHLLTDPLNTSSRFPRTVFQSVSDVTPPRYPRVQGETPGGGLLGPIARRGHGSGDGQVVGLVEPFPGSLPSNYIEVQVSSTLEVHQDSMPNFHSDRIQMGSFPLSARCWVTQ